ncbi:hypothetical protein AAFF_G00137340 [Aldrovandia affinis]|uniref:Uncharacterized protein n=1 Tax=Aldrovandia affinis TaxID=143900 RepID=A0AAD7TBT9_9TELE|nr:hypothetical protein AAFF_G00137340 [Aldrovandia affinis]
MRVQIQSAEEQRRQHAQTMEIQIQNTDLLRAELKERFDIQEEHALAERVRRANPAKFLAAPTANPPLWVQELIHKLPPTRSPRESPVRRRPWLKRKLDM